MRVLFFETSHMRSFVKVKPSRNSKKTLAFTDVGKPCPSREILMAQKKSANAIHENKILAKISEFTLIWLEVLKYI